MRRKTHMHTKQVGNVVREREVRIKSRPNTNIATRGVRKQVKKSYRTDIAY